MVTQISDFILSSKIKCAVYRPSSEVRGFGQSAENADAEFALLSQHGAMTFLGLSGKLRAFWSVPLPMALANRKALGHGVSTRPRCRRSATV